MINDVDGGIPTFAGRIAECDPAKGCGWIETDGQRIFLHRREFAEWRKRPQVGDAIGFTAGTDRQDGFAQRTPCI